MVSTGAGTTSFEDDGNTLDGWRVAGPPAGSPGNPADWMIGTTAQAPSTGKLVQAALDRQPDFLKFLFAHIRPLPVQHGRRRRRRCRHLRSAGEPDPPGVRQGLLPRPGQR